MRSAVGTPVQTGVTHLPSVLRSVSPLKIRILHGMSRKLRGSEASSYNFASRPHTCMSRTGDTEGKWIVAMKCNDQQLLSNRGIRVVAERAIMWCQARYDNKLDLNPAMPAKLRKHSNLLDSCSER